jgi:hypothetical protein
MDIKLLTLPAGGLVVWAYPCCEAFTHCFCPSSMMAQAEVILGTVRHMTGKSKYDRLTRTF